MPPTGVALVHNGIIENFRELRAELSRRGVVFATDTDTEVIAHLSRRNLDAGHDARRRRSRRRSAASTAPSRSPSCSTARTT